MRTLITMIASLVTYILGELSKKFKHKEKANEEGKEAVENDDTSGITGAFDRL